MKKVFSILTLALLMLSFTACNDNENESRSTFPAEFLNNSVNISSGNSEKVSNSSATMELDLTKTTLSLNYSAPITSGNVASVTIKDAELVPNNELGCYTFTSTNPGTGIANFNGLYRPEDGSIHIEFDAFGTHHVSSNAYFHSSAIYFPYSDVKMTNTEDESVKENKNAESIIIINPSDMSAVFGLGNFAIDNNSGTIQEVDFSGLKATATGNGFNVTITEPIRSVDGYYTLNSFEASVTGNGRVINANFVINTKYSGVLKGTQFAK